MKKAELVFIPAPGMGHLLSMVEAAKLLIDAVNANELYLSIIILIIKPTYASKSTDYIQSLNANPSFCSTRIRFIDLPQPDEHLTKTLSPGEFFTTYIENHKPQAKEAIINHSQDDSVLAGIVIDMFCTSMIDVADELGVPNYMFFTSGAAMLDLMFYLQYLHDQENLDTTKFIGSDDHLDFPGFVNPLPGKVLPSSYADTEWANIMFDMARRFRETKGIMVNSFTELESHALNSLYNNKSVPPVYPVGPLVNLKGEGGNEGSHSSGENGTIFKWLDDQPESSVVFLCFGSMGSFYEDQVKEIAYALEQSGHRFLWSLRKPPPTGVMLSPSDYPNPEDVLPDGFLDRTSGVGKVIGWAPQVRILSHQAIGGFVSHCGWNSTLESLWLGVPIATWPLYAEQQLNAFQLVVELGLAVEIQMDYHGVAAGAAKNEPVVVCAEKIKKGIMGVMERESDVRKRVEEMSEKSRSVSALNGGSSYSSLRLFISHVIENIP